MGCNSHIFIEVRSRYVTRPPDGTPPRVYESWHHWAMDIQESRDYGIYGALAGVRSDREPVVPVRGLPSDMGYRLTELFKDDMGGFHTPTWLIPSEFREALSNVEQQRRSDYETKELAGGKTLGVGARALYR